MIQNILKIREKLTGKEQIQDWVEKLFNYKKGICDAMLEFYSSV